MAIGLAGGLGRGLVEAQAGFMAGKEQMRQQAIQDEELAHRRALWSAQEAEMAGEDAMRASNLEKYADPNIDPFAAVISTTEAINQAVRPTQPQAPMAQPQPVQQPMAQPIRPGLRTVQEEPIPAVTAPTVGAGAAVTVGAQPQALVAGLKPLPVAITQQPKTSLPPELAIMKTKYDTSRQRVARDIEAIKARTAGNAREQQRQLAAYQKALEKDPEFQSIEKGVTQYLDNAKNTALYEKANAMVTAIESGDDNIIESQFGYGAKYGKDPATGLPGVIMPNGAYAGKQIILAKSLLKYGLGTIKDVVDATKEETKNYNDILKATNKNETSLKLMELRNKAKADLARMSPRNRTVYEMKRADLMKFFNGDETRVLQALHDKEYEIPEARSAEKNANAAIDLANKAIRNLKDPMTGRFLPNVTDKDVMMAYKTLVSNGDLGQKAGDHFLSLVPNELKASIFGGTYVPPPPPRTSTPTHTLPANVKAAKTYRKDGKYFYIDAITGKHIEY